jgi:hypothetical protein
MAALDRKRGGRSGAIADLTAILAGYSEARELLQACRRRARHNARSLDFWFEGLAVNEFHGEFLLAALTDSLPAEAGRLRARIEPLRAKTRELFSETYAPQSVADELRERYGFFEAYLDTLVGKGPPRKNAP